MKKLCVVIIFTMMAVTTSTAVGQVYAELPLKLGVKVGFNRANVNKYEVPTESRTAFLVGIMALNNKSPLLSYQIELLFTSKGFKRDGFAIVSGGLSPDSTIPVGLTVRVTYIEVPFLVHLKVPTTGKYRPFLVGGGFFAIRVRESIQARIDLIAIDFDDDNSKKSDVGLILGGGLEIKTGGAAIIFETRLEMSMTKAFINSEARNKVLSFQFGYLW